MAKNKAQVQSQYQEAYITEQEAQQQYEKLMKERYGRVMSLDEFKQLTQDKYGENGVWNMLDIDILNAGETAQSAGARKSTLQKQYDELNEYFARLDDAQRAYTEGNYAEVQKRLYYEKDANKEALESATQWSEDVEKVYEEQLKKMEAAFTLARETNAKLAQSDVTNLLKTFIETANAGMKLGGKKSGEIFNKEFKDLIQQYAKEGYDVSDLISWGKEAGIDVGEVFGDEYDEIVQAQIDQGFDVSKLLEWGAESGKLSAAEYVKYFKQNVQRELDSFMTTDVQNPVSGPLTYEEMLQKRNNTYGPHQYAAGTTIPVGKEGIVAEAGPELLRVMNGGVQVTNLTPTAMNETYGAGGKTVINNYYNSVSAEISNDYDVYELAEDLAQAESYISQGKGE